MRAMLMFIGLILSMGAGASIYLGVRLKKVRAIEKETKRKALEASQTIKKELEFKRQRDQLRLDWDNEHLLLSDATFAGFKHTTVNVGGTNVSCPKCKEL